MTSTCGRVAITNFNKGSNKLIYIPYINWGIELYNHLYTCSNRPCH